MNEELLLQCAILEFTDDYYRVIQVAGTVLQPRFTITMATTAADKCDRAG